VRGRRAAWGACGRARLQITHAAVRRVRCSWRPRILGAGYCLECSRGCHATTPRNRRRAHRCTRFRARPAANRFHRIVVPASPGSRHPLPAQLGGCRALSTAVDRAGRRPAYSCWRRRVVGGTGHFPRCSRPGCATRGMASSRSTCSNGRSQRISWSATRTCNRGRVRWPAAGWSEGSRGCRRTRSASRTATAATRRNWS
jgi:hypothetical protein